MAKRTIRYSREMETEFLRIVRRLGATKISIVDNWETRDCIAEIEGDRIPEGENPTRLWIKASQENGSWTETYYFDDTAAEKAA